MTILAMATADYRDSRLVSVSYPAKFSLSNTYARTGSYSYAVDDNGSVSVFSVSFAEQSSTTYFRFGIRTQIATDTVRISFDNGVGNHITMQFQNGAVIARLGGWLGPVVGSGVYVGADGWICVEVKLYIHNSSGIVVVKVDGQEVINVTGVDTQNADGATQSKLGFGCDTNTAYFDDIIVRNDDWPGRGGIYVLAPNAGSTTENWTPSAGNPEDCVDENPPDFTDYISTDTSIDGTDQLFGIESLPITPTTIHGVGVVSTAALDNVGTTYGMSIINSNGTKASGDPVGFTTASGVITGYWHENPDDSAAWENADIDALEVGIESTVP